MFEITQNAGYIPIILMGTNKEIEEEMGELIPSMDIDQFMFKYGINHFIKISMSTGEGIRRAFEVISDEIIKETIRKLGPDEIKRKTQFSYAIAMIGDKIIRKDLISEYDSARFAAPTSTMGGAISRKTLDRDIHHLIPEPRMDKDLPPAVSPQPEAELGKPTELKKDIEELSDEIIEKIAITERLQAEIDTEQQKLEEIVQMKQEVKEPKKETISGDEIRLEKPKPLAPMKFKETEEDIELPSDLKDAIEKEVKRVRSEIADEEKKEKIIGTLTPSSAPPPPPPGSPPPIVSLEEKPEPISPPKPRIVEKPRLKAKKQRKLAERGKSEMESMAEEYISEPSTVPEPFMVVEEEVEKVVTAEKPPEDFTWGGAEKAPHMMEITTEKLKRKTTVFYRERMNPETLNKLAVVLSTEKIYEKLKITIEEVARAATDKILEIDKDLPIVDVVPEFPGCVCVPSVQHINAEKEYDVASFLITPLQTGEIPDAKVKLYHKGQLIETIPTPTKVVKTTSAKISAGFAIIVPLLSQFPLISNPISNFLGGLIPFYETVGGIEGIILMLTALFAALSGLLFLFKRPKDAKPVETFPEIDDVLNN